MQKFNINLVKSFLSVFIRFAKNKFAILNNNVASAHCVMQGVETPCYLTSITFDSLSEKIKNLRLVIKKIKTMEDIQMRNIKKIFIVVFSLILLFAVSCSNDDKTGVKNNPPENDTEITDGETGSGSSSGGSSETGTGG